MASPDRGKDLKPDQHRFTAAGQLLQIVFPQSDDLDTGTIEQTSNALVSLDILCELLAPKAAILRWHRRALRASMPEASVDKKSNPEFLEEEIGFSWDVRPMHPPT
jgi:hypothetical protein